MNQGDETMGLRSVILRVLGVAVLAGGETGCLWLAVGGTAGGEGGYVASQDKRTAGETVDDQLLFTKVKAALLGASKVSSGKITVSVRRSVVTLKGVVDSREEKDKALAAAKDVSGVKGVVDKLFIAK
jgi:hyperosmotically inducible protein